MIIIKDKKFIRNEQVRITGGILTNVVGHLENADDAQSITFIKVGSVTHTVPYKWIEKIEPARMKLFLLYTMHDNQMIYSGLRVGVSEEEIRKTGIFINMEFMEVDEVDGYDVILQK
jgi:hypothetical protein